MLEVMLAFGALTISSLVALCVALPRWPQEQLIIGDNLSPSSAIRDILVGNEIIADVLDDFEPTYALDLAYPKHHEEVALGNDIPVKAVTKRPTVSFYPLSVSEPHNYNFTFTLVLTDPDALSRDDPSKSEMCHWILSNLTLPSLYSNIGGHTLWTAKDSGELEKYQPPSPPKGTGRHRYVFVLLTGEAHTLPKPPTDRPHWGYGKVRHGVRDWAKENDLTVVGANFFFAQHKK